MKFIKLSETIDSVWLRYADTDDPAKAKEWIDVQVPIKELKFPPKKLGMFAQADVDWGYKAAPSPEPLSRQPRDIVRAAILRYVRTLIDKEIKQLEG